MTDPKQSRRLAAIMFTDIVGYTALMQRNEAKAATARARHRRVFDQQHHHYRGEILQYFGDGTLSIFQSGVEAVECAIAIQTSLQQGMPLPLRIGLHLGDLVFDGTEIYGDSVNVAARIESMGVAGAVLLSSTVNDELKNHPHLATQSLGHFTFKNIARPIQVFAVSSHGLNVPQPTELKGKHARDTKAIAVLPIVNMSADPEQEYFSDGMTEEIINALSKIKKLKVTSRTSSFHFKGKNLPIAEIGKALQVSTILEGSVRLSGDRMRITAQLIDVAEDFHFWSETFDRPVADIFAVQDEISLLIANKLRQHLGYFDLTPSLVAAPAVPVSVYQRYLKSRYHLLKMTKAELDQGMQLLQAILREQPDFALAHLAMHLAYTLLGTLGLMPAHDAFRRGRPYLDQAISLQAELPECQLQLSYISFLQHWNLSETYAHLQKAFELRPTVEYYQSMASVLVAERKFSAALHYLATAFELDPFSAINHHLKGFILYVQEKYGPAIDFFSQAHELDTHFSASILYRGQALLLAGRHQECLRYFQELPAVEQSDVMRLGGITLAQAAMGQHQEAEAGITQLEAALSTELMERAMHMLVLCQATLGKPEACLQLIERAIAHRLPMMVYMYAEPMLAPLRQLPRFQRAMQQVLGPDIKFDFSKRQYRNTLLDEASIEKYKVQLEQLMLTQRPYLNPNLTLRSLAAMIDLPPNYLSRLLNKEFDQNFSAYINTHRLVAFQAKAADPANHHLTLLALAYDCGFNSKTVFNTFFKKVVGQTPKAWWKNVTKG